MSVQIEFIAKVWMWPGDTPWHFVSLSPELSLSVREKYPKSSMVKVLAKVGNVEWQTSLFRNARDKNYIMPIKKKVRNEAGIFAGDVVEVRVGVV